MSGRTQREYFFRFYSATGLCQSARYVSGNVASGGKFGCVGVRYYRHGLQFLFLKVFYIFIGFIFPLVSREGETSRYECYGVCHFVGISDSLLKMIVVYDSFTPSSGIFYNFGHVGVYDGGGGLPAVLLLLSIGRLFCSITTVLVTYIFRAVYYGGGRYVLKAIFIADMLICVSSIVGYATCNVR